MKLKHKLAKAEYVMKGLKQFYTDRKANRKSGDSVRRCIKSEIKSCKNAETVWADV